MKKPPELSIERVSGSGDVSPQVLFEFIKREFAYMNERIDPPSSIERMTSSDVGHKMKTETLFMAKLDGRLVGCMFCRDEGGSLYIGKVAVSSGHRRLGIGNVLLREAFRLAERSGHFAINLESRVELTEVHAFFERNGFIKTGETSHEGYDRPTSYQFRAMLDED